MVLHWLPHFTLWLSLSPKFFWVLILGGFLAGCEANPPPSASTPKSAETLTSENKSPTESLSARGKKVYQASCTTCHNANPKLPGNVGPEVWGSSLELLEARVLKAEYPTTYKPKRATKAMAPLPHLKNELSALHALFKRAPVVLFSVSPL